MEWVDFQGCQMMINPWPGGYAIRFARDIVHALKPSRKHGAVHSQPITVSGALRSVSATAGKRTVPDIIRNIFRGMEKFPQVDVFVHGSWADDTTTAFSDLDDLIIYRSNSFEDPELSSQFVSWLNTVDMKFCRLDPLQHHGHWMLEAGQLDCLDESYIPLTVIDGAIRLQGRSLLNASIDVRKTVSGLTSNIKTTINNIKTLFAKYKFANINLYQMKGLIGSVLLMPAYAFQQNGKRVSKKWAIENASELFSPDAMEAISWSSHVRSNWHLALDSYSYCLFAFTPYLFFNPHLYRLFAQKAAPSFPADRFPELSTNSVIRLVDEVNDMTRKKKR